MSDTSEFIDKVADKVEQKSDSKIPNWAYRAGFGALITISCFLVVALDQMRMASIDRRFEALTAAWDARAKASEDRLLEGERVRIERTKQLEDHETRITSNRIKIENIEGRVADGIDQLRRSVDRLEGKVDKLKDKP